jgi:5S rRNA maturation endonuclease (ribonuclease M5)
MNRNYEEVLEGINEIRKIDDYTAIVVEGKLDKKALEIFGIENVFIYTNEQKVVNEIKKSGLKEAVILTDYDEEGRRKNYVLKNFLTNSGIKVNNSFRIYFRKTFRITKIEEMVFYFKVLKLLL